MADTFDELVGRVQLRCPMASTFLARDWVRDAFRGIARGRDWSWLLRRGQFLIPAVYSTGTVSISTGSRRVNLVGGTASSAWVGRQFRSGSDRKIFTVEKFVSTTEFDLDEPWAYGDLVDSTYQIFQCFFAVPDDFRSFHSVVDFEFGIELDYDKTQSDINNVDAKRTNENSAPWLVVPRDMTTDYAGTITAPVQVVGSSGVVPEASGGYSGVEDALFTVTITTAGDSGTAVYKWRKDSEAEVTGLTTSTAAVEMSDGVFVSFPSGATYDLGDIHVIRASTKSNPGVMRYEIWPHVKPHTPRALSFVYVSSPEDIDDPQRPIPRYIDGDVIKEFALMSAALWPGTEGRQNPYRSGTLAEIHMGRAEKMLERTAILDDDRLENDVMMDAYSDLAFGGNIFNAEFLQKHEY